MIHMNQLKLPLEQVMASVPAGLLKKGVIGEQELELVRKKAAKCLRLKGEQITELTILKKSLDARRKQQIQCIYQIEFSCPEERKVLRRYGKKDVWWKAAGNGCADRAQVPGGTCSGRGESKCRPVVVGFGPAGMFAALELARAGRMPIVLERGQDVDSRQKTVSRFWEGGVLDEECNVQFGEGGAGTFSDGKLNTLVKDASGRNRKVLETFVLFGAPSEILYLQKPHIGTDRLKTVVKAIRKEIISLGGEIFFGTKLTDFRVEDGSLRAVRFVREGKEAEIPCRQMLLAMGHSARDTFLLLKERGVLMEQKAFAVGVRLEHPQEMIGQLRYGDFYKKLPAAEYKLTAQTEKKRGVYSFCMCPGGYVVNASSEKGMLAVNGMSDYGRDGKNANSAIVVTVSPQDFGGNDVLAGMEYQRKLEKAAYRQADGLIPVQLYGDFRQNRKSSTFGGFSCQMKGGYAFGNLKEVLPEAISEAVGEGIALFGKKLCGYDREDAILSGVESRTSSPVRVVRDDALQANIRGIYPCGEGAGYAGGITSAAMDGIRVAEQIVKQAPKV